MRTFNDGHFMFSVHGRYPEHLATIHYLMCVHMIYCTCGRNGSNVRCQEEENQTWENEYLRWRWNGNDENALLTLQPVRFENRCNFRPMHYRLALATCCDAVSILACTRNDCRLIIVRQHSTSVCVPVLSCGCKLVITQTYALLE